MESVVKSLWVGMGGFIGANARFWLGEWFGQRGAMVFPWGTFAINILGSLIIGGFFAWELAYQPHFAYRLFFAVGICGGFTTFSSFSWESFRLMEKGNWLACGGYIAGSVILCIAACTIGFFLARLVIGGAA